MIISSNAIFFISIIAIISIAQASSSPSDNNTNITTYNDNITIEAINCGQELCYTKGGYCGPKIKCICYKGYTTRTFPTLQCDYKMISKFKAGLIELFFGFGFGQFYAERKANGRFKLFLYLVEIISIVICLYHIKKIRNEEEAEDHPYVSLFVLFTIVFLISLLVWQVIDGFLFFFGSFKDGNGMVMY